MPRSIAAMLCLTAVATAALADDIRFVVPSPAAPPGVRVLDRRGDLWLVEGPAELVDRWPGARPAPVPAPRAAARAWTPLRDPDPRVQNLADQVVWGDLQADLEWLVGLGVRHSLNANIHVVADQLEARFAALGLATEQHDFTISGIVVPNVIATQVGEVQPDSIVVVCAHYDATSEAPEVATPGADDNASGAIAVLTCARLLAGHQLGYTVQYALFGGEEQGLRGSRAWVQLQASQGAAILGALNFDMVGWWEPGVPFDLEIETNAHSQCLAAAVVDAATTYADMPFVLHEAEDIWWGDFYSFWQEGYAAVNHEEAWDWGDPDFNPRYHTTGDLVIYLDPTFTTRNVRVAVTATATVAGLAGVTAVPSAVAPPAARLTASPNPFNGRTTLALEAPGVGANAEAVIYDLRGRRVDTLVMPLRDGRGTVDWDAADARGRPLATGAYVARVDRPAGPATCRLAYVK
ncbi:MAG TPA: M28 family peptidase [Candidatus Krumholzibacteria bacterium]|nr:M28 family peptidase [Candidatus Krumholzibacteria bacterium]HPD72233.1 M28 family peptidase [Candidatus Krumholzibacteria bacterium]HRY40835.1 M28 family peptidase [Candidatus Krumholzibacteria bacterium]